MASICREYKCNGFFPHEMNMTHPQVKQPQGKVCLTGPFPCSEEFKNSPLYVNRAGSA